MVEIVEAPATMTVNSGAKGPGSLGCRWPVH